MPLNWNVMQRDPDQPHFSPLMVEGLNENDARWYYRARVDRHRYRHTEFQLVTDYTYHYEQCEVSTAAGPVMSRKHVIDGWRAVETNGRKR